MKAQVLYSNHDIRYEEKEIGEPAPTEVKIEVEACGVCATDVKKYTGKSDFNSPLVAGHEISGKIVDRGDEAKKRLSDQEKVAVAPVLTCGKCSNCISGATYKKGAGFCNDYEIIGHTIDGGFAEYVNVPIANVYRLPENVTFEQATLTEPIADCLRPLERIEASYNDNVLVMGAGFMGLSTVQLCNLRGMNVIVGDLLQERLNLATELGADETVNPKQNDLESIVEDFTNGKGMDMIVWTIGLKDVVEQSFSLLGKGGKGVLLASFPNTTPLELNPNKLHYKNISVHGSVSYTKSSFWKVLSLLNQGKLNSKKLITKVFDLQNIEEAFEAFQKNKGIRNVIKV